MSQRKGRSIGEGATAQYKEHLAQRKDHDAHQSATTDVAAPSRIDVWSLRLSAWAQVVTLVVVIFGYLYTVIPVVQKERLEEEVATLERTKDSLAKARISLERDVVTAKDQMVSLSANANELRAENRQMEDSRTELQQVNRKLAIERASVGRKLEAVSVDLAGARQQFSEASQKLFIDEISEPIGFLGLQGAEGFPSDTTDADAIERRLAKGLPEPTARLGAFLAGLRSPAQRSKMNIPGPDGPVIHAQLVDDFERRVELIRPQLALPRPDTRKRGAEFVRQLRLEMDAVPTCLDVSTDKFVKEQKWSEAEVAKWRGTASWNTERRLLNVTCETMPLYDVRKRFAKAWWGLIGAYIDVFSAIVPAAYGHQSLPRVDPALIDPPSYPGPWFDFTTF